MSVGQPQVQGYRSVAPADRAESEQPAMGMVEFRGDETGALHRPHPEPSPPVVKRGSDNAADGADGLDRAASGKSPRRSAVCVRLPEESDWPDLRQLVRRQHQRTIFADIPFSEAKLEALVQKARHPMPNQCLIVAEARGQIVGAAWCSAGEYLIGEGTLMTTVHLLAVDTERCGSYLSAKVFLRLLQGVRLWSDSIKATHVLVHVTTGTAIKATDRLMRATGAKFIGGGYVFA